MKNLKHLFQWIILACITTMMACNNEDDGTAVIPDDPTIEAPSKEDFSIMREDALNGIRQSASFNAGEGISFTSENGVVLNINADCLTLDDDNVTGEVELEFIELFDRGTMLSTNKPTMGITPEGGRSLLISGGEFYINATQNGQSLELSCGNMQLIVPADLSGGADQEMTLWSGIIDDDGNLAWEEDKFEDNPDGVGGDRLFVEGDQYFAFVGDFGWTNVDRFHSDPRPKTTVQVEVPEGYDAENSAVYLSYDGEGNALAQLDTYDLNTGIFSEHYGMIPIGLEMHIIFITEEDGQWKYAIKGVVVEEDDIYTFTLDETTTGSEQDLNNAINALP
ncbi:hypothetical protein JKA74_01280 [Marivirga sp. S37H4]|uniref:Uncharacterized protein n=1 Tax=Marivirga aurantiaca TaxID=2802615 RepID=A0A935C574_9BACT|nr:hypothetical protein [Marivirga aurantiaca]MBK6263650.1 hypothetical protein [Marivirga aurantiaca]